MGQTNLSPPSENDPTVPVDEKVFAIISTTLYPFFVIIVEY
jgi:hypothetical protein